MTTTEKKVSTEYLALEHLHNQFRIMPNIMDNDYAEWKANYTIALRKFLTAVAERYGRMFFTHIVSPNLNDMAMEVHRLNIKWWQDIETGQPIERNKGELIALMHSELSETLEGVRKGLMDDKLPHRTMEEVELADTIIRILDYAGGFGLDIDGAYHEKNAYNKNRADHKHENRVKDGGKKF